MSGPPSRASPVSDKSIRSALSQAGPPAGAHKKTKAFAGAIAGEPEILDANTLETIKFETSIDIDNFLNMPMHKKLKVSEVPDLACNISPVLIPRLVDGNLLDLEGLKMNH